MEPFVQQLIGICRAYPTRAKWVFVQSHSIGRTLGDRLVVAGCEWANLRFVTPLDIALRMGAPFLVERGINPSEDGLGPALVMRLLLDLSNDQPYFRPQAHQPRLALALWATLRELRMAGLRSADLVPEAFGSPAKHAELRALVAAYEGFLERNARGDYATVFEEALRHRDWCPIQPTDCWIDQPGVIWAPLARRLIEAMPGEGLLPAAIEVPGLTRPRALQTVEVDWQPPDPAATLAWLMNPAGATSPRAVALFHAGGADAEVEEVFRRVLRARVSLDHVEIACGPATYAPLIWEKACRYEWPVTTAHGVPATLTRPGRALLGFAEWIEDDFAAGLLRRLLQSGDVALPASVSLTPARAARLLVKARAAWGRHTYALSLNRLAASARGRATRDDITVDERSRLEKRAAEADELAEWCRALVAAVPLPGDDGMIALGQVAEAARAFVDVCAARASALDTLAAARLVAAIEELRALGDVRCSLVQALRFLRERVEGLVVGADRPRPGHLHISALATAGLTHRPKLFVVGLEEGRVLAPGFEDPILLDAERARISPLLPTSRDRTDETVYAAVTALAGASSSPHLDICLSYSSRDLREFRATYPSWLMLQAFRASSGKVHAGYKELEHALGPPKSCVPDHADEALGESRWWLRQATRSPGASRPAILQCHPALAAGLHAEDQRASPNFTEFDGHVPAAGVALDPCAGQAVVSPTQLEEAAECPFRHFLQRGLGLDPLDSGERDRDVWINPLIRGTMLHDLYALFLRRCRTEGRRPSLADDGEWLAQQGHEALGRLRLEMPPPSSEIDQREAREFLADLALFAEAECAADERRTPVGLEVAFGRGEADPDREPLAHAAPIVIQAGDLTFRLVGRVDRIDRLSAQDRPPTFEIVDYKTGGFWPDDWVGIFDRGRRLQHALYGLAAAELLRRQHAHAVVSGAQYYFSSAKGRQHRVPIQAPPAAEVASVLADLRTVIASGLFIHAEDDGACKWCEFGRACGESAFARAKAKRTDPLLLPNLRLLGYA